MKTKSIRLSDDIQYAVKFIEREEKIEEATAIRKLMRVGFESYIGNLYKQGKITLREASDLLNVNQIEAMNIFLDAGIKGNLDASDVIHSLERFVFKRNKK